LTPSPIEEPTEYYLIYRTEKGNPESATHAAHIVEMSQKLAATITDEIKKRYGNETFGIILFRKQKMSAPQALKLKHLVEAYYCDDYRFACQQNRVLFEIEEWVEGLKTLQNDPGVVWESSHTLLTEWQPPLPPSEPADPLQIRATHNVPIDEPMYSAAKTDRGEPYETALVEIDPDAKRTIFEAQYEAGLALMYADDVDRWHYISKIKYDNVGWKEIARTELKQQVKDGKIKSYKEDPDVVNLSVRIGNAVKSHREKMGIVAK
jgi:hypothetical protein